MKVLSPSQSDRGRTGIIGTAAVSRSPTLITHARRRCEARWTVAGRLALTPLPPLTNRIWRRGWKWLRNGGRMPVTYKSTEARAWQSAMGWQLRCALPRWSEAERQADWAVQIWLYFPDARRRDPDGPIKLLLDTIAAAVGCDDRHLLPQVIGRTIDPAAPRVEVALERLPASAVVTAGLRRGGSATQIR